ncbi:MAG: S9 family peptidase, partial [Phycisphaerales bacterium]|nr:S9 family peptidase [Phycisphaerales bacterium]
GVAPTTPDTVAPEATPGDTTASTVKAEDPKKEEPKNEEKKAAPKKTLRDSLKTDPSNVEVWHAKDIDIQPMQKRRANRDQRENFLASWRLDGDALVMLGNDLTERTILLDGQAHAIGLDHTPHEVDRMFGPTLNDVYVIDVASGERTPVREAVKYVLGGSPDGRHVLYQRDGDIWAYDIVAAAHRNLTGSIETEFTNVEDSTLTDEKRAHGVGGWTDDGSTVLLYDRFDIWAVPVDGSPARRLTSGADDMVRYRRVVLDREDDEFVPTDEPMIVSIFSERTKRSGYGSLGLGGRLKTLVSEDAAVGGLTKADDVDVYAYRVERYDAPTRYVLAGRDLKADRDLATSNTFIADEFLWGRGELIAYENDRGVPLLGALYYPADYDPDRTYPMIVYIYEELSDGLHRFQTPSEQSPYNTAVWSAEGYFVFQPDIVYRPQNPGLSALECLEPAVAAAVATGMIDADHVGLCGHSWGAYQTAFVVTRSDVFAAGIAGAPLTNMMSMSMSIYWNSGQTDAWIFHESQGRMDQPFWRDVDTYIDNSPIFGVDDLNTPLLIAFGDEDGAVDWNQGVEMYNAARLAGKPLVMLVYPGENHGLAKKPNQIDYHYRILEWFGHYLKGDPAPDWITRGMPHLERQKELEAASKGNARGGRGGGAPTGTPPGGRRGRGG